MIAQTLEYERRPSALATMLRAFLPGRRHVRGDTGLAARWRGHRADERELRDFLRLTGLPEGEDLPLLYPHTFGFPLSMAVLTHPSFPVPIWRVLQTRNRIVQHRAIARGQRLDLEVRHSATRVITKGLELDLHTTVLAEGVLAWQSLVTFLARGRFGPPEEPGPTPQAPRDTGRLLTRWTMADDAHLRFGRFTGDYNGIHTSDWYARRLGFASALYHPSRVLGQCLARLPAVGAGVPVRLEVWLKGPVPHGASVELHARSDGDGDTFALFAEPERPSIVGQLRRVERVDDPGNAFEREVRPT